MIRSGILISIMLVLIMATPLAQAQREVQAIVERGVNDYTFQINLDAFERPEELNNLNLMLDDHPEWLDNVKINSLEPDPSDTLTKRKKLSFDVSEDAPIGEIGIIRLLAESGDADVEFDTTIVELTIRVDANRERDDAEAEQDDYIAPTLALTEIRIVGMDSHTAHRTNELGYSSTKNYYDVSGEKIIQLSYRVEAPARIKIDEPFSITVEKRHHILYGDGHKCPQDGHLKSLAHASLNVGNGRFVFKDEARQHLVPECLGEVRDEMRLEDTVNIATQFDPVEVNYQTRIDEVWVKYTYEPRAITGNPEVTQRGPDYLGRLVYFADEDGHPLFDLPDPANRTSNRLLVRYESLVLTYEPVRPGLQTITPLAYSHPRRPEFPPRADPNQLVTVPPLGGLKPAEARLKIDDWGMLQLEFAVGGAAKSPEQVALISHTEPPAHSRVARGSALKAFVAGPYTDMRKVPYVLGMSLRRAQSHLVEAGLSSHHRLARARAKGEADSVVSQSIPDGSKVLAGTSVELTLAGPWLNTLVPDLVGLELPAARDRLRDISLAVEIRIREARDENESGRVIEQSLPAGSEVEARSMLILTVGGPWIDMREVPSVLGATLSEARSRLEQAGLVPKITIVEAQSKRDAERVTSQSVRAGTQVEAGTTVRVGLAGPWVANVDPEPQDLPSPDELCRATFPGSYFDGTTNSNQGCLCPDGKKWNQQKTACVKVTVAVRPRPPERTSGCDHPWKVMGPDYGGNFPPMCECRYGKGINSFACLPPSPPGHQGCPPGTRKEYSQPSRLGLGCECIHGVENRVCIINSESSESNSAAPSRCPPGTHEVGGTLGQESTRCVPD